MYCLLWAGLRHQIATLFSLSVEAVTKAHPFLRNGDSHKLYLLVGSNQVLEEHVGWGISLQPLFGSNPPHHVLSSFPQWVTARHGWYGQPWFSGSYLQLHHFRGMPLLPLAPFGVNLCTNYSDKKLHNVIGLFEVRAYHSQSLWPKVWDLQKDVSKHRVGTG